MISKELMSEVLNVGISDIEFYDNEIEYSLAWKYSDNINVYELAHKCKEWAYNKEYLITENAYQILITDFGEVLYEMCWNETPYDITKFFNVCEWILQDMNGQK